MALVGLVESFIAPETKACPKTIFPEIIVKFTSDVEVRKSKIMSYYFTVLNILGTGQYINLLDWVISL